MLILSFRRVVNTGDMIFVNTFFILLVIPFAHGFFEAFTDWWGAKCKLRRNPHETLANKLRYRLYGQHIVEPYVKLALENHLSNDSPEHALSIVLMGSTGTGKTYLVKMIADSLFASGSDFVKFYSGRLDFPSSSHVDEYRARLKNDVENTVRRCPRSIFIFDEIDKVPPGVIDQIKPFLDYQPVVLRDVDFRKAIFIFLTNWGSKEINSIYLDLRNQGLARESMQNSHFEKSLRQSLYDKSQGMFHESDMIKDFVISHYLPFLPLEGKHVNRCIIWAMKMRDITPTEKSFNRVLSNMEFFEGLSVSGCKRVADLVSVEAYRRDEL